MAKPVVAWAGRFLVGKSTLVNCLRDGRHAWIGPDGDDMVTTHISTHCGGRRITVDTVVR